MKNSSTQFHFVKMLVTVVLSVFLFNVKAQQPEGNAAVNHLVNQPLPAFNGTTIQGAIIDPAFFKGKITLLVFSNLNNSSSLQTISWFNRLLTEFDRHPVQVLGIMANSVADVTDFNSETPGSSEASQIRLSLQLPPMKYPVLAVCEDQKSKKHIIECDHVAKDFGISNYPVVVIADANGMVRFVHTEAVSSGQLQNWYNQLSSELNRMLKGL